MIRPGPMRHRVRLEVQATSQDASGEQTQTWSLFSERWAEIEWTPGRELWASAQRQGRVPTVFHLRYLDGVLPSMRVVYGTRVFNILSAIDQSGRREELVLTAEELIS